MTATLQRRGLGYSACFGEVEFRINRLRESGGELKAQLRVVRHYVAGPAGGETLWRGSANLSSDRSRASLAGALAKVLAVDPLTSQPIRWDGLLNTFATQVLDAEDEELQLQLVGAGQIADEPRALMGGSFLTPGERNLLYAPGGTGKTTIAAAVALSLTTGAEIIPGWPVAQTMEVLILDFEDRPQRWHRLFQALARGAGLPEASIRYLRIRGRLADHLEQVASIVTEHGIGLLIIDSAEAAAGVSDGDGFNDRVARLYGAIGRLGVTTLMIDHVTGTDARADHAEDMPYGGVFKVNWSRQVWRLQREKEPQNGRADLLLVNRKVNDGPKAAPISLSVIYGADSIRFERTELEAPELVKSLSQPAQILHALRTGAQSAGELSDTLELPAGQVRSILNRLQKSSRVVKLPTGHWGLGQ